MLRKIFTAVAMILILCSLVPARAQVSGAGSDEALSYVKARQGPEGGFAEPGAAPDPKTTCWAMLAGASAGEQPLDWRAGGVGPLEYLEANTNAISGLEDIELVTLALAESGGDPRSAGGKDLVALLKSFISQSGKLGADIKEHCMGMLALLASGEELPPACTEWLIEQQRTDGGWGDAEEVTRDTALAVEALVAAGEAEDERIDAALSLLEGRMEADGGFKGSADSSDAQVTAAVVRAIYAAGDDPGGGSWDFQGNTPLSFLASLQQGDGHLKFTKGVESEPAMTTAMAVPAMNGSYFPVSGLDMTPAAEDPESQLSRIAAAGAELAPGETRDKSPGESSSAPGLTAGLSAGAHGSSSRAGDFWVFLAACGVFLVVLMLAATVARYLARPPEPPFP